MNELYTTDKLIQLAKEAGINFGKTDPYNRLRYYTKIGWLPHMIRKLDQKSGEVLGHYPSYALKTLVKIETLKKQNTPNDKIEKILINDSRIRNIKSTLMNINNYKSLSLYATTLGVIIIIVLQLNIQSNNQKLLNEYSNNSTQISIKNNVLDSGVLTIIKGTTESTSTLTNDLKSFNVNVTPTSTIGLENNWWVEVSQDLKSFTLKLSKPLDTDIEFNWVVVEK